MFSFNSQDDEDNTPFFDDNNQEKSSFFNTDNSEEFDAYQLFNSHQNYNSGFYEQGEPQSKMRSCDGKSSKSSKKSLIMQLDQFDRKQSFANLQNEYMQQLQEHKNNSQFIEQRNSNSYFHNNMAESRVKKYEQNQSNFPYNNFSIPNSKVDEPKTKFNFNKLNINLNKNSLNNVQGSNDKFKIIIPKTLQKLSLKTKNGTVEKKQEQTPTFPQQILIPNNNKLIDSRVEANKNMVLTNIQQNLSENSSKNNSQFSFKSKNNNEGTKIQIKDSAAKPFTTERLKFGGFNLKGSRAVVANPQQIKNNKKQQQIKIQNPIQKKQPIKYNPITIKQNTFKPIIFNNTNNNLKKNEKNQVSQLAQFPQNQITAANNKILQQQNQIKNNKQTQQTKQFKISNQMKTVNSNAAPLQKLQIIEKKQNISIKSFREQTDKQKGKIDKQMKQEKPQIKKQTVNTQKPNQHKQRPSFNLKLLRQPNKNQKNNNLGKKQFNNFIMEQKNKRQQNQPVKAFKNNIFSKNLNSNQTDIKPATSQTVQSTKQQKTPKIIKIQKNSNLQNLQKRTTQKLSNYENKQSKAFKQIKNQQKAQQLQHQQQLINPNTYKIDYEKYEQQLNIVNEEIAAAKRRSFICQQSYRDVFQLLNKTNIILSNRFMSQMSQNQINQIKQSRASKF